jgi:hypothetical protein
MGWQHVVVVAAVFGAAHWHLSRQLAKREQALVEMQRRLRRRSTSLDQWEVELRDRERCADLVDGALAKQYRTELEAEQRLQRVFGPDPTPRRAR